MEHDSHALDSAAPGTIPRTGYWPRREFVKRLAALAGPTGWLGLDMGLAAAEPRPEITGLRLTDDPYACLAPQYLAEPLLKAEGFEDVRYINVGDGTGLELVAAGKADMTMEFAGLVATRVDAGDPLLMLAGVHAGCFELFGTERVHAVRDLKGKTVAVLALGAPEHLFLSSMLAYVGLDPRRDINWVAHSPTESMQLLAEGKVDGFLAFPPEPQELKAKGIGHVVVNTAVDKPWSEYFCCMLVGNREFVHKHPAASKRALRAVLKAADLCAQDPARAARLLVEKGHVPRYDYAVQVLKELPYRAWRSYDPEDTLRFYSLRLHELGMIKASPQKILAQGADWSYLNQLKKELKA